VLEANFWPGDARLEARVRALGTVPVEVHCQCPIDECMRRYAERAPSRHPVHVDSGVRGPTAETFARSARPIRRGPVITVDTSRPVDTQLVAAEVWRLLGVSQPAVSRGGEPFRPSRRVRFMIEQLFVRVCSLVVVCGCR
jgi:hypothetical protein